MSEEQTTDSTIVEQSGETPQANPTDTFLDSLPEDIRDEASLKNFTNAGDLAKSYIHAQKMVGADKIPLPGKHSTDEDWSVIYNKLGRPEVATGYEFEGIENIDEGVMTDFKDMAHKSGLSQTQAAQILNFYNDLTEKAIAAEESGVENNQANAEQELRKEFGLAYEKELGKANYVFKNFIPQDLKDKSFDGYKFGDHPGIIKALAKLGNSFSEDEGIVENNLTLSPKDAEKELAAIMAPGSPYWDKKHPNHNAAVQEALELQHAKLGVSMPEDEQP